MSDHVDYETLERWMQIVLNRARAGIAKGQSPFAAAIYANDGTQLSLEHNTVARTNRPSRHGEVNAIDAACRELGQAKLRDTWLISTGEPCPMCAATAALSDITQIAFGASEKVIAEAGYETLGVCNTQFFSLANCRVKLVAGVLSDECEKQLLDHPA